MRWIKRLTILVAALCAVWVGLWYLAASMLNQQVTAMLSQLQAQGTAVRCSDQAIGGFPFRIGPHCSNIAATPQVGSPDTLTTGDLRAEALLLDPGTVRVALSSPLAVTLLDQTVSGQWTDLEFVGDMTFDGGFDDLRLTGSEMRFGGVSGDLVIGSADVSLTPMADTIGPADLRARLDLNRAALSAAGFGQIPDVDFSALVILHNSYGPLVRERLTLAAFAKAGFEFTIERLQIKTVDDGMLNLSGPLTVDASGLMSGTVQVAIAHPDALRSWAAPLPEALSQAIATLVQAVAGMGAAKTVDGLQARSIDVTLDQGDVKLGFITLAQIPPIRF